MKKHQQNLLFMSLMILLPSAVIGSCTCDAAQEDGNRNEALKYKLGAILSIFVASLIGVCLPLLGKKIPALNPENNFFFIIKAFAAGVILATGFIHILPDAFESLTSPCLNENPWGNFPFAGFIAMLAAIGTLMVDVYATSHYTKSANNMKNIVQALDSDEERRIAGAHTHATHGHSHGPVLAIDEDLPSSDLRYRVISQVLELGIIVHSVIIGITLGASDSPKTIEPLLAALTFHQFFEGIGLGGCIAQVYHSYAKEIEKLKEEVRMMILAAESNNIVEKITLIDIVERLGLSYHFEEEIEQQLELMFNLNTTFEDYDLCKTALLFRIFRQHGYKISCGSFDKFVDENGKFKETLSCDIKGMLSLFEAAQVRTQEDAILEEALAFTKANLKEKVQHCSSSSLMKQVTHALYQSLHRGVPRLEARHYITIYEEDESRNELLLSLAKRDYNLLQMLHKEELSELLRWWKELNISKLPYIRDRMVECYFWSLTVYFEPQFSFSRIIFTKITVATSVLDDTIDAYATVDEIPILSDAIQRWDEMEAQGLTGYIKACFLDLLKIYREVDESLRKEGSSLGVHHLKEALKQYAKCSNIEAMWFMKGELPTFAEYLSNASITSGYYVLSVASFLGMKSATKEVFDWVETTPKIFLASMAMSRLANDVASHRIEKQRANATGIDCYMKNYKVSEQEAMAKFEEMVEDSWKDINMEMLVWPMAIPRKILVRVLSLTRSIDVIYKNREDGYTEPQKVIAPHIIAVLLDPVVL